MPRSFTQTDLYQKAANESGVWQAGVSRLALISYPRQSSRIFVELPRVAVISTVRVFVVQGLHEVRLVLHALGSGPLSGQVRLRRSSRAPWGLLTV